MSIIPMIGLFAIIDLVILGTIPAPTHVLIVDLPMPGIAPYPGISDPIGNHVRVHRDGSIRWNNAPVTRDELITLINATFDDPVEPYLIFTPDADAAFGDVLPVLNLIRMSGVTAFCFGGLEQHRDLGGHATGQAGLPSLAQATEAQLNKLTLDLPPDQASCDQLSGLYEPPPPPS